MRGQTRMEASKAFSTKAWNTLHDFCPDFQSGQIDASFWKSQSADLIWQKIV